MRWRTKSRERNGVGKWKNKVDEGIHVAEGTSLANLSWDRLGWCSLRHDSIGRNFYLVCEVGRTGLCKVRMGVGGAFWAGNVHLDVSLMLFVRDRGYLKI